MDNYRITAKTPSELWMKTVKLLLEKGNKKLNYEILNLVMIMEGFDEFQIEIDGYIQDGVIPFTKYGNPVFDSNFRKIFGDERIDHAKGITFIWPDCYNYDFPDIPPPYKYSTQIGGKWSKTYWGRMWNWEGEFNQVEQAIKRLKEGKNSKTICINVYHPSIDGKKTQAGIPCLLSLDIKPRSDGLHLTAFYRSMRISKSGYADFVGLLEFGNYLCSRIPSPTNRLQPARITIIGSSVHLGTQNEEMKKTKKLLSMV